VPRSVREVASVIYRRALKDDLIRGRSIEGVATATLYAACRKEGIPRSLEEISEVSRVERKEIGRTYRYVSQELGLEMEPVDPKKYVPRFCSDLGAGEEVRAKANEIIEVTAEKGLLSGKSPTGYAAAAIYAASLLCNEKKTQREVADVAQVTEVGTDRSDGPLLRRDPLLSAGVLDRDYNLCADERGRSLRRIMEN
jgi:transcription initiation factor TFIIB